MSKVTLEQMPRSPTSKRMIHRVSPIYDNSYVGKYLYEALGKEFDGVKEIFHTLREQRFPDTVTWGIRYLEHKFSIEPDESLSLEERRARLKRKAMKRRPLNPGILENYIKEAWNIVCDIDEKYEQGVIKLEIFEDEDDNHQKLINNMQRIKPAHLVLAILFDVYFGDEDDEATEDISDINDDGNESFSVHTSLNIEEDIPYGNWYNAPKYDGSVRCSEINSFTGTIKYDGNYKFDGLNSSIEQYAENCGWWFASNGESRYNKEFQYDGAIQYNGKRPYKIEYNNGMDELAKIEINQKIEEDVSRQLQFDGGVRFDGNAIYNSESIPTDNSGDIEITKYRRFNGNIRYDGAGVNLNDGSLKFNGLFDYSGGGERAQIETFTDDISGNLELKTPEKSEPFGLKYPELFDDVPTTTDKQSLDVTVGEIAADEVGYSVKCDGKARFNGSIAIPPTVLNILTAHLTTTTFTELSKIL